MGGGGSKKKPPDSSQKYETPIEPIPSTTTTTPTTPLHPSPSLTINTTSTPPKTGIEISKELYPEPIIMAPSPAMRTVVKQKDPENLAKQALNQRQEARKHRLLKRNRNKAVRDSSANVDDDVTAEDLIIIPKEEIVREQIRSAFATHFLFSGISKSVLEEAINVMKKQECQDGIPIITEGETGNKFFVLYSGSCHVHVKGKGIVKENMTAGASFGEIALMYSSPRTATIRATSQCVLWYLDRRQFRTMLQTFHQEEFTTNRQSLEKVPMLMNALEDRDLDLLAESMQPMGFLDGQTIIQQGEIGTVFYIIMRGKAMVSILNRSGISSKVINEVTTSTTTTTDNNNEKKSPGLLKKTKSFSSVDQHCQIRELPAGAFFGERALLFNEPRSATITAVGATRCGAIDRETFLRILGVKLIKELHQHVENWTKEQNGIVKHQRTQHARNSQKGLLESKNGKGDGIEMKMDSTLSINKDVIETTMEMDELTFLHCIGRGAFGFVHLVFHETSNKAYALKTLQKKEVEDRRQENMVVMEKNILNDCCHPMICELITTFQDNDCLYMLMELLQGGDLYSALSATEELRFGAQRSRFYIAGITEALHFVHMADVMFRDLKPENLVLHRNGYVKLVDFGCAKRSRHSFTLCGTPDYIAPEIILGKGHGQGVDWWAMGVTLYEFRFGDLPFAGNSPTETYTNILQCNCGFPDVEE